MHRGWALRCGAGGIRLLVLCGLLVLLWLSFGQNSASASYVHEFASTFGASGSGDGQLSLPAGVAVNASSHDVYVADAANHRVDEFSAAGSFVRAFGADVGGAGVNVCTSGCLKGSSSSAPGGFVTPTYVAIDNSGGASEGDVYVADTGEEEGLISKFDAEGKLIESWGTNGQIKTAPIGEGGAQVALGSLGGVAVDGSGELFVVAKLKLEREHFYKFAQDGSFGEVLTPAFSETRRTLALDLAGRLFSIGFAFVEAIAADGEELGHVTPEKFGNPVHPATGLAVDPGPNDAFDPTASDLYVDSEGLSIDRYATSCEPKEGPCTPSDTFGEGSLSGGAQMGVDQASHRLYVVEPSASHLAAFEAFVAPDVATEGTSEVKGKSATIEGSVDPNGVALSDCRFEYGTESTEEPSASCEPSAGSIPADSAIHPVSAHLTGLQPGTTYHYRLSAANAGCLVCRSTGAEASFTTLPPPSVTEAEATSVTATSAVLQAEIDPKGADTKYHFEWGPTTSYSNTVPIPDGVIPASAGKTEVSAVIEGLSANKTYHWRIVASNENGSTTTTDQTFVFDTLSSGLPDGRAYEMVTPPSKNAALIGGVFLGTPPQVADDGAALMAASIQCFAGSESCVATRQNEGEPYLFSRTSGGWQTTALAPPASQYATNSTWMLGPGEGTALFSMPTAPARQDDWYVREPDGSFSDVGPMTSPTLGAFGVLGIGGNPMAASADGSHVVFMADKAVWPFDAGTGQSVYQYAGPSSSPQLVGVSGGAGSHDLISRCGSELGGGKAPHDNFNTLSADGSVVYFTALRCSTGTGANEGVKVPAAELYARIDGAHTVLISGRDPTACTTLACTSSEAQNALFEGASADGARVIFASTQQLTNEASQDPNKEDSALGSGCGATIGANGCNLYEMEDVGSANQRLTVVSAGDSSGGGARAQGAVAISADGSHVYFIAKGVLTSAANAEGEHASNGAENLYAYERDSAHPAGQLAFVARLSTADEEQWSQGIGVANVTPDGRFLVFTSHRGLTADATRPEGPAQVYEYDAQGGTLTRLSKGQEGFNNNGNSGIADASVTRALRAFATRVGPARPDPTMSHDGSYVFFQSPVALTPQALDDVQITTESGRPVYAQNIYEYHAGQVYLISDGKDTSETTTQSSVELLGSDANGSNVFFSTADRLVPQDTDTQRDYYDARICIASDPCVPAPAEEAPACEEAQACRGLPASSPPASSPGSFTFSGAGNLLAPAPVAEPPAKPLTRAQKLAKALRACRARHPKRQRVACERQAHKRYGAHGSKKSSKAHGRNGKSKGGK
jgi:hypothetical protein